MAEEAVEADKEHGAEDLDKSEYGNLYGRGLKIECLLVRGFPVVSGGGSRFEALSAWHRRRWPWSGR